VSLPDLTKETFESGLQPSVRITEQPDGQPKFAGCTDNQPIDYLPATEFTRFKAYAAFWRPANYPATVAPPCIYRLQVELFGNKSSAGLILGFADVQVISQSTIKSLQSGQYIPLPKDLTLPFWFFIGQGAVCPPDRDCVKAAINPSINNTIVTKNLKAGIFIPANAFTAPVTLVIEEQTARPCIDRSKLGLPQFSANGTGCYRYQRFPDNVALTKDLTVAMCVEIGLLTHDQADRLQIFRFDPGEGGGPVTALQNAPAGFLPCDDTRFPPSPVGLVPRVLDNLAAALLGPRVLHAAAIHVGVGGTCIAARCLSSPIFTWGMPGAVSPNSADPQTAPVGTAVGAAPSVKLMNPGHPADLRHIPPIAELAAAPIAGVPVTFRVSAGDGRITVPEGAAATSVVVPTGFDGVATLGSWTLGATPGTNTVVAEVPGADGSPVTFAATAIPVAIVSASLGAAPVELDIGGLERIATVSVINGTGEPVSGLLVEAWIRQGSVRQAAGFSGDQFSCAAVTTCVQAFNFVASCPPSGQPGLVVGSATAEFDLTRNESVLHTFTIPITLTSRGPCL